MKKLSWLLLLFLFVSARAFAEQDFYGIQFANEKWARALILKQGEPDMEELASGPILNHSIRAEASLKETEDNHIAFNVTVFNDMDSSISVDYRFRDFYILTKDGRKYSLVDTEEDLPSTLDGRSKMSFAPSFGNLTIRNNDVEMVVCSFDLGRIKVVLLPWSKKEAVAKVVSPEPPPMAVVEEPAATPKKGVKKVSPPKKKSVPESGPRVKTPKRNFWDWLALDKDAPKDLRKAPVMPTAVEKRSASPVPAPAPELKPEEKLNQAIQNFKYVPSDNSAGSAPASYSAPVSAPANASAVREEAHVIGFNKLYNFVTLNLGKQDGLQKNAMLSIVRDGKVLAKARVKQIRDGVAAASVLPDSVRGEIKAGDGVAFV